MCLRSDELDAVAPRYVLGLGMIVALFGTNQGKYKRVCAEQETQREGNY
jgi:hypothetical protein